MTQGKFPFNKNLNIGSGDLAQTRQTEERVGGGGKMDKQ